MTTENKGFYPEFSSWPFRKRVDFTTQMYMVLGRHARSVGGVQEVLESDDEYLTRIRAVTPNKILELNEFINRFKNL